MRRIEGCFEFISRAGQCDESRTFVITRLRSVRAAERRLSVHPRYLSERYFFHCCIFTTHGNANDVVCHIDADDEMWARTFCREAVPLPERVERRAIVLPDRFAGHV